MVLGALVMTLEKISRIFKTDEIYTEIKIENILSDVRDIYLQ